MHPPVAILSGLVIQSEDLVIKPTKYKIVNEESTTTAPIIAYVIILRAASTCLGSPPDVISLIADQIIRNIATAPTKVRNPLTTLWNTTGKQRRVATPSTTHEPQSWNILIQSIKLEIGKASGTVTS